VPQTATPIIGGSSSSSQPPRPGSVVGRVSDVVKAGNESGGKHRRMRASDPGNMGDEPVGAGQAISESLDTEQVIQIAQMLKTA